jgi:hypothetical protein
VTLLTGKYRIIGEAVHNHECNFTAKIPLSLKIIFWEPKSLIADTISKKLHHV